MKIICFPHFYYLSEVSRLIEIGKSLRALDQEIVFFSHGGSYESFVCDQDFPIIAVEPTMSPLRAQEYMKYNRGEGKQSPGSSFFTYQELKAYVMAEADALRQISADAVLIGWNLPSYLSVQLVDVPIIVQQPGSWTAPFFDYKLAMFVPAMASPKLAKIMHYLPMDRFFNWLMPRLRLWIKPFNKLAAELGLPQFKSTLDFMAGDLTLVMDTPSILGISKEALESYTPSHPEFFHKPPKYRYGGPCYAKLPGNVPEIVQQHFKTDCTKLYCAMGVSGSQEILKLVIEIVSALDLKALIVTSNILSKREKFRTDNVLLIDYVPAHLVNPLADIAITHGGAGTIQTAINSGTPLVGIPMHQEQAGNISIVKRHGAGLMLWKQLLTKQNLERALKSLAKDLSFKENMHRLKKEQDQVDGASNAAREIVKFLNGG